MLKLYKDDCLEILQDFPANSIDAIITDPPYSKKFLYLYKALAIVGKRILKRGGSFISIAPHYALPTILEAVGEHLKYRWTLCMWQAAGPHPRMAMGIEILWKPVIWWVKGAWPQGRGFVADGFECPRPEKGLHRWQQNLSWAQYCMRFVSEGGLVLDPLMGTGTVGIACLDTGRSFIGIELSDEIYAKAEIRLEECLANLTNR